MCCSIRLGGEFCSLKFVLHSLGISYRVTCPYSHVQNGTVEQRHRHIVETGLSLMAHASVPPKFWVDAFQTMVYLINCMPTPVLKNSSPFQKLFHHNPDYNFLHIFGVVCWPNLRPFNRHKMDLRSHHCVFMGYSPDHKGFVYLHLPTSWRYISRDVVFSKRHFPFASSSPNSTTPESSQSSPHELPKLTNFVLDSQICPN